MDVCILLGSRTDLPIAEKATKVLDDFGVAYELRVASAHRAPKYLEGIIDVFLLLCRQLVHPVIHSA